MPKPRKKKGQSVPADEKWISPEQAGKLLGIARGTVLARALRGDLVTQHIAGRTLVSRESVDALLAKSAA